VDEEGVALGLAVDGLHHGFGRRASGRECEEARHVIFGEAAQQNALGALAARQLGQRLLEGVLATDLDVAVGADQQDAALAEFAREELHQQQGGLVGPVEIVEHDHQR
jgi:hypothetical protein